MGRVGADYGSERQLLTYRRDKPEPLDEAILSALGVRNDSASIEWLYPDRSGRRGDEFKGVGCLKRDGWAPGSGNALSAWRTFWPSKGSPPSWDGIAILRENGIPARWLLLEAKANHVEFVGAPSRAAGASLKLIQKAVGTTKKQFGVHYQFDWTGSYYQLANRLTVIAFLNRQRVPATLVELLFTGDCFPDARPCPPECDAWATLIEARRLTLGLPPLTPADDVVDVFLPALRP